MTSAIKIKDLTTILKKDSRIAGIAGSFGLTALLADPKGLVLTGGNLITSIFQRRFKEQLAETMLSLVNSGGYKNNASEDSKVMSTYVMLLKQIDENPDEIERLNAMKALFVASISKETPESDVVMLHELAQKARKLFSIDIIVLRTCYFGVYKNEDAKYHNITYANEWRRIVTELNNGKGDFTILVTESEKNLISLGLIDEAQGISKENIHPGRRFRLSDLGISFCVYLEKFSTDTNWSKQSLHSDK